MKTSITDQFLWDIYNLIEKGENVVYFISQKRKDNKWIMVIFDIPQKQWKARNLLKSILHNLKYRKFQQSVWVTPYDVFEKTEQLLQYYSLEKYVRIFLIEEL